MLLASDNSVSPKEQQPSISHIQSAREGPAG